MMRLAYNLFEDDAERNAFIEAMLAGDAREQAILALIDRPEIQAFPRERPEKWQPPFVVRLSAGFRPSRHVLYEKGAIYSLDFSSAFAATVMLAIQNPPEVVLDLCAAPGGKSIFAWRAFQPKRLICNETIRKRCGSLIDNLMRCQIVGSEVGSADPSVWARAAENAADLVIVDAPCSGQSLIAKGDAAPGCFAPHMIDLNVGRQRRILGNAARCVRPGGHLLYMTCTFTPKENEKVVSWLIEQYPEFEAVESLPLAPFRSKYAEFPCYRLFPQQMLGAGAFSCLLHRKGEGPRQELRDPYPCFWRYGDPKPVRKPSLRESAEEEEEA